MGKLRKIGKKIGRGIKSIGKKFKKGLGKIARAFGKLGPLGSIALSFIIPGVGGWIGQLAGQSGVLGTIATGIQNAAGFIGEGASRIFTRVTDAIGAGMNKVGGLFNRPEVGTNFQNFVSEVTNGFVKPTDIEAGTIQLQTTPEAIGETVATVSQPESFVEAAKARGERMFTVDKPSVLDSVKGQIDPKTGEPYTAMGKLRGSAEYAAFKGVAPIKKVGAELVAADEAEKFAIAQAKQYQREYFSDFGQQALVRQQDPATGYIDFNNPNPSDEDMYNLNNAYGLILG